MVRRNSPESLPAPRDARLLAPLERFIHVEAASGIFLLAVTILALVWANSPWHASYESFWHAPIEIRVGGWLIAEPLHFWINEGLMTVFLLVVGLEIRREMREGALSSMQLAALPVAGALGGILVPAAIYLAMNIDEPTSRGWAVPTATDIAFAVGVLMLLGRRVPAELRVLLLALAIIDDVAAILIIALVYSGGIEIAGLGVAALGALGVIAFQRADIRYAWAYVLPGAVLWAGLLMAGLHPALAGVVLGLMTPVTAAGRERLLAEAAHALDELGERTGESLRDFRRLVSPLRTLSRAHRDLLPPVMRVEAALHGWVAFGVMPLFALANAGVHLAGVDWGVHGTSEVFLGIALGLTLGKPAGVLAASWLAVRLGLCSRPPGVTWGGLALIGSLAGIGFTMAIFIGNLAFPEDPLLAAAKVGVIIASSGAAAIGLCIGYFVLGRQARRDRGEVRAEIGR
jgi:NhaA family Na+:H+ antiporter